MRDQKYSMQAIQYSTEYIHPMKFNSSKPSNVKFILSIVDFTAQKGNMGKGVIT